MLKQASIETVQRIDRCRLSVGISAWAYALDNAENIDTHWEKAKAESPFFFNGVVHMIDEMRIEAGVLKAQLLVTDFKSYLYWRNNGYPDAGVLDGFGSALLRASDGAVLLGRQREGNINSGLAYLPGGFIDARDVAAGGTVDLASSIARELTEETGLDVADLAQRPGFYLTCTNAQVSFAVEFVSRRTALSLKTEIEKHLSQDPKSELTDIIVVRTSADLEGLAMPPYACVLMLELFKDKAGGV